MTALGWLFSIVGIVLYGYGYFVAGTTPLIDWQPHTPWWIADFLPNLESEIGLVLMCLGILPKRRAL